MKQQQTALFGKSSAPTEVRSRPRAEAFDQGRAPVTPDPRLDARGQFDSVKAQGQLPMFLSAREVLKNYRVLDGDRQTAHVSGKPYTRLETDREVMWRKGGQAALPSRMRKEVHGAGLAEQLAADTYHVESPIPLQVAGAGGTQHTDVDPEQRGAPRDPRPQTLNGGHRLAVMSQYAPDMPMPVEHHDVPASAAVEKIADPEKMARVTKYQQDRTALRERYGELRTGKPSVPGPWEEDAIAVHPRGLFPAQAPLSKISQQFGEMDFQMQTDMSNIRQRQQGQHQGMRALLARLRGTS